MEIKLLKKLEERMYLYFFGKNINNIKFKYNTKKMIVCNRLPFFRGGKGMDWRLLNKVAKRKKRTKMHKLKFTTKYKSSVLFTEKQKLKLVNKIFKLVTKTPIIYNFFFILREGIEVVNWRKDPFIITWYSGKAPLKKLLLALDIVFEDYVSYNNTFVTTAEFHYWYKEIFIDVLFERNRVKFLIGLPKQFKKEIYLCKKMYFLRRFKELDDEEFERSVFWYRV